MSSLIPPTQRPTVPGALGNHEARIRALERQHSGGSDYVFLEEIVNTVEDGSIHFEDIVQSYRHLVMECSLNSYGEGDDDEPGDLEIRWGASGFGVTSDYDSAQQFYDSLDDPSFPIATKGDPLFLSPHSLIAIKNIMPGRDEFGFGDVTGIFASITLKFLYYASEDRAKTVLWNAVSTVPVSGDGSYMAAHNVGGGVQGAPSDSGSYNPIVTIYLDSQGLMPGSKASLYGIR